jgi:hypothetical protein
MRWEMPSTARRSSLKRVGPSQNHDEDAPFVAGVEVRGELPVAE